MASDILIIPSRGSTTSNPVIQFSGSAANTIRLETLPSGSVSFMGTSGSLFSIVDSISGSLMAVSDISGIPILEVFSDDKVVMGKYNTNALVVTGSNVGVGKGAPSVSLDVSGSVFITGSLNVSVGITSSLFGTSSYAVSASYAPSAGISGGTANYVARFTSPSALSIGKIYDNNTSVGINTTTPNAQLDVNGNSIITGSLTVSGSAFIQNLKITGSLGVSVTNTTTSGGTTTLTKDSSIFQIFTGSATQSITLPAANVLGSGIGAAFFIKNYSSSSLFVNAAGTDNIELTGSLPITAGSSNGYLLISDGSTSWRTFNINGVYRTVVGADPTGNNDASAAINAAINEVSAAGGGTVFVPRGVYKITGVSGQRILIKNKVNLEFAPGSMLMSGNHSNVSLMISIDTTNQSTIRDVTVEGNGLIISGSTSSAFTQYGFHVNCQNSSDVLQNIIVRNINVIKMRTDGLTVGGSVNCYPTDIFFQNVVCDGCYRNGGSVVQGKRIYFEDCRFINTAGASPEAGFDVEPDANLYIEDVVFTRCSFRNNAGNGLYVQTARTSRAKIVECDAVSNTLTGFAVYFRSFVEMDSCTAYNNGGDGIFVLADGASVNNCTSFNNTGYGIKSAGSNSALYSNCECYANTQSGIIVLNDDTIPYTGTQTFSNCSAYLNKVRGFIFNGAVQASAINCSVYANAGDGVQFYGSQHCSFIGGFVAENSTTSDLGGDNIVVEANSNFNSIGWNKVRQSRRFFYGTATAGSANTVTLPATRYGTDNFYSGSTVRIISGTGSGQSKPITSYVASTGVVTVATNWAVNPNSTSVVQITAANRPRYGINVGSGCTSNAVYDNDDYLSGATNDFVDSGTTTQTGAKITQLNVNDGSATAPSISFKLSTGSGLFRAGTDNLKMALGGLGVMGWDLVGGGLNDGNVRIFFTTTSSATNNGALIIDGGVGIGGRLSVNVVGAGDGTLSAPTITFANDSDTGFYRGGSGNARMTLNGTLTEDIDIVSGLSTGYHKFFYTTPSNAITNGAVTVSGGVGISGSLNAITVNDIYGNVRAVPQNAQTALYTLALTDIGRSIYTTASVTLPPSVFSAGDVAVVINSGANPLSIFTGSGVTIRLTGTTSTGNRTVANYGMASITCVASNTFYVAGSGVT